MTIQDHGPAVQTSRTTPPQPIVRLAIGRRADGTADFSDILAGQTPNQRTYQVKKLVERNMLQPIEQGARTYVACFANSYLIRGVMRALAQHGFIPAPIERPTAHQASIDFESVEGT